MSASSLSFPSRKFSPDIVRSSLRAPSPDQGILRDLPIDQLNEFTWVDRAFAEQGLVFAGALAIVPSNPSFIDPSLDPDSPQSRLIPGRQDNQILIHFNGDVQVLELGFRGYRDLIIVPLDAEQNPCESMVIRPQPQDDPLQAPTATVMLDVTQLSAVRISAATAFLIDAIRC